VAQSACDMSLRHFGGTVHHKPQPFQFNTLPPMYKMAALSASGCRVQLVRKIVRAARSCFHASRFYPSVCPAASLQFRWNAHERSGWRGNEPLYGCQLALFREFSSSGPPSDHDQDTLMKLEEELNECLNSVQIGDGLGSLREAQAIVNRMELIAPSVASIDRTTDETLFDATLTVLDAWMQRYDSLSAQLPELQWDKTVRPETVNAQIDLLRNMISSVEASQDLIEKLDPRLSRRHYIRSSNAWRMTGVSNPSVNTPSDSAPDLSSQKKKSKPSLVVAERCERIVAMWSGVSQSLYETATSIALLKQSRDRYWRGAQTKEMTAAAAVLANLRRGIPQRAQFLVDQMDATCGGAHLTNHLPLLPSLEAFHRVLDCWRYSDEHLRGAMAERVFVRLATPASRQEVSAGTGFPRFSGSAVLRPSGETYRLIILAWATSRDRRSAFTATGHLMKMLRKLQKNEGEDMDPGLPVYQTVLDAWTRAE
jgi:hypothetical protein